MSLRNALQLIRTLGRGTFKGLPEASADQDPIELFAQWFRAAERSGLYLPEAVTLATATADGKPSARMVLLKGFDASGFTFYTNFGSHKAAELTENPRAALVAHWSVLQRQVRVEGSVARLAQEASAEYFATRSRSSRISAWASRQSARLENRGALERRVDRFSALFEGKPVPLPDFWGGFRLAPMRIEFWQGRADRLHDRLVFTRSGAGWTTHRLYP